MQKQLYAGFWLRFIASIIDCCLSWLVSFALSWTLFFTPLSLWWIVAAQVLVVFIGMIVYEVVFTTLFGGTIGKLLMNITVLDYKGKKLSYSRSIARFFAKIPSILILGIGYLMVAWTERKQGLHDIMVESVVLKRKTLAVPNKVKVGTIVAASVLAAAYIVYMIIGMAAGISYTIKATTLTPNELDPAASVREACAGALFYDECLIAVGQQTLVRLDAEEAKAYCAALDSSDAQDACYTQYALSEQNAAHCEYITHGTAKRSCTKTVSAMAGLFAFAEANDPYKPTLNITSITIGEEEWDGCDENRKHRFEEGDYEICFIVDEAHTFTQNRDELSRFDMSLRVWNSTNNTVAYSTHVNGFDEDMFLRNGILLDQGLTLSIADLPPDMYTFELTVYDKVGYQKGVYKGNFSIVPET
jgi:uncharacterized RDD family membrane protein YckC